MNLTTQEAQVACFRNAAAHLQPSGCFVIKVMIPELQRLPPVRSSGFSAGARLLGDRRVRRCESGAHLHHVDIVDGSVETVSMPFRCMARRVRPDGATRGMRLRERGADGSESRSRAKRQACVGLGEGGGLRCLGLCRRDEGDRPGPVRLARRPRAPRDRQADRRRRRGAGPGPRDVRPPGCVARAQRDPLRAPHHGIRIADRRTRCPVPTWRGSSSRWAGT